MRISNKALIIITGICIILYSLPFFANIFNINRLTLVLILNTASSLFILLYWTLKQFRIKHHFFELRETLVLGFEALILGLSSYALFTNGLPEFIVFAEYGFFGLHLFALVCFLIFTLIFKMNKLF